MDSFAGKTFVIRVDAGAIAGESTLIDDLHVLAQAHVRPIVVAPHADGARALVRTINRAGNVAVRLDGADAAMLPAVGEGLGRVQTGILETLLGAGYVPVIEPTAFSAFSNRDARLIADDVAAAVAAAVEAVRAIFFHSAGGVVDPQTQAVIEELTPAEALSLADDVRVADDLRAAIRAAAMSVRHGVPAVQIVDGRVAHAAIVELLTQRHLGTQVTGGIYLAA